MHIMDIFQNSVSAGATEIGLSVTEDSHGNMLHLSFSDNGCGMSPEMLANVTDPYFTTRTTRKVGLGLSLLRQNAERTGGTFNIRSKQGRGTEVNARFVLDHLDRPVMGDVSGAVVLTASANPGIRFVYSHTRDHQTYRFDTREVLGVLDGVPLNHPRVIAGLCDMINENLKELNPNFES